MSTKTVSFKATEDQVKQIDEAVESGQFTSRGEYLRNLLREHSEPTLTDRAVEKINRGRKQISEGEGTELEDL
jgi:Arc/MetJ-type ribon-helix-helix transcriptional regulator